MRQPLLISFPIMQCRSLSNHCYLTASFFDLYPAVKKESDIQIRGRVLTHAAPMAGKRKAIFRILGRMLTYAAPMPGKSKVTYRIREPWVTPVGKKESDISDPRH